MIWLLIAISSGSYNHGTVSSVEFNSQEACIHARQVIKSQEKYDVKTICVPKGTVK